MGGIDSLVKEMKGRFETEQALCLALWSSLKEGNWVPFG